LAGKFISDAGTDATLHTDCLVCSAGQHITDPATDPELYVACSSCPIGKYIKDDAVEVSNHDEAMDCKRCAPNHFATPYY